MSGTAAPSRWVGFDGSTVVGPSTTALMAPTRFARPAGSRGASAVGALPPDGYGPSWSPAAVARPRLPAVPSSEDSTRVCLPPRRRIYTRWSWTEEPLAVRPTIGASPIGRRAPAQTVRAFCAKAERSQGPALLPRRRVSTRDCQLFMIGPRWWRRPRRPLRLLHALLRRRRPDTKYVLTTAVAPRRADYAPWPCVLASPAAVARFPRLRSVGCVVAASVWAVLGQGSGAGSARPPPRARCLRRLPSRMAAARARPTALPRAIRRATWNGPPPRLTKSMGSDSLPAVALTLRWRLARVGQFSTAGEPFSGH